MKILGYVEFFYFYEKILFIFVIYSLFYTKDIFFNQNKKYFIAYNNFSDYTFKGILTYITKQLQEKGSK